MQQQIDDIDSAAAASQGALQSQYAKYQSAIQSANSTLDLSQPSSIGSSN